MQKSVFYSFYMWCGDSLHHLLLDSLKKITDCSLGANSDGTVYTIVSQTHSLFSRKPKHPPDISNFITENYFFKKNQCGYHANTVYMFHQISVLSSLYDISHLMVIYHINFLEPS